jgi:hypothetical protein
MLSARAVWSPSGIPVDPLLSARPVAGCDVKVLVGRFALLSCGRTAASTAVNIAAHLLASEPFTDSFLTTGAGDITLWIPANLRVTVRAQNETPGNPRRIVSDFAAIPVKSSGMAVIAEGSLNGGGPLVRLVSTGGTIYIRRDK